MTTDVINGVPRSLLEHICDAAEGLEFSSGFCLGICDELRTLLATAQPQQAVAVTEEVRHVPLYEAVERACGELPDGWAITLQMENGAGWVDLYDAEGSQVEDFPTNNERLDYTLNDAVDAALSAHKTGEEE